MLPPPHMHPARLQSRLCMAQYMFVGRLLVLSYSVPCLCLCFSLVTSHGIPAAALGERKHTASFQMQRQREKCSDLKLEILSIKACQRIIKLLSHWNKLTSGNAIMHEDVHATLCYKWGTSF